MTDIALEVRGLSKSFGGALALDDVSLQVRQGEIHGLVGRNGSGKSTLIKVLAGFHVPEPGASLTVGPQTVQLPVPPGAAQRLALSFVHQDLGLIPSLSILENLRVGRYQPGFARHIAWPQERARVREALRRFHLDLDMDRPVSTLTPVQRALIAIARAVSDASGHEGGVIVLDEPTSYLPANEVAALFAAMRRAAGHGNAVIFVSHRLEEVKTITDRVTVLRDARVVGTVDTPAVTEAQLIHMILGREIEQLYPGVHPHPGEVVLAARGLTGQVVHGLDFEVHKGEIVGLAGLVGMGQNEVPYLLFGAARARHGEMVLAGRSMAVAALTPEHAAAAGMALVPGDRLGASGVGHLTVRDNVSLPVLSRFFSRGVLSSRREHEHVAKLLVSYGVRPPAPDHLLATLSGGNQQKALLAKWLQLGPAVFLLDEPSQGVDIGARKEIFARMRAVADEGTSIVMASSEFEDLAHVCDRVLVFRHGRLAGELAGEALTEDRLIEQCYSSGTDRAEGATGERPGGPGGLGGAGTVPAADR